MREVKINNLEGNSSRDKSERLVFSYLKKNLSPQDILKNIKNTSDIEPLSQFLYNSGSYKELLKLSRKLLKANKPISWTFVLPVVLKAKVKINSSEVNHLYHSWLKDYVTEHPSIFTCQSWEMYSEEFSKNLNLFLKELKDKTTPKADLLLESLNFLKAQNLMDEESKIIKELLAKEPKNKKYQELYKSLQERKAIKVIEDQKRALYKASVSDEKRYFKKEDTEIKQQWSKIVEDLVEKRPDQIKNLSLFLYFLNWPDKSIDILTKNLKKLSDYWFYLDWLIETRQYTKVLNLTNQLLEQIKDSEMIFPLIYIKSQSLYHLGKKEKAIEYLDSILKVRPDYRSAQSLLEKWTKN